MTSLMTTSLILFSCWVMITSGELLRNIQDFLSVYNGHFSNIKQVKANVGSHDLIQSRLEPVLVLQLQSDPMIYFEESINGTIFRMIVGKLTEDTAGSTVFIEFFNFIDFSTIKPDTYKTKNLKNVPRENFKSFGPCPQTYLFKSPGVYSGSWVDCGNTVDGQHPSYSVTLHCDRITLIPSVTSPEKSTPAPYVLLRHGNRYPLINPPADFVYPCPKCSE